MALPEAHAAGQLARLLVCPPTTPLACLPRPLLLFNLPPSVPLSLSHCTAGTQQGRRSSNASPPPTTGVPRVSSWATAAVGPSTPCSRGGLLPGLKMRRHQTCPPRTTEDIPPGPCSGAGSRLPSATRPASAAAPSGLPVAVGTPPKSQPQSQLRKMLRGQVCSRDPRKEEQSQLKEEVGS